MMGGSGASESDNEMDDTSQERDGKIRRTLESMQRQMKLSDEEIKYRMENFDNVDLKKEYLKHLKCTKCNMSFQRAVSSGDKVGIHPLLGVLMCDSCCDYYGDGNFSLDSEGEEKYCRWCGEGGTIFACNKCVCGFCDECIKKHFGEDGLKAIQEDDDWICYFCDPKPLWYLRSICFLAFEAAKSKRDNLKKNKETRGVKKKRRKKENLESDSNKTDDSSSTSTESNFSERSNSRKKVRRRKLTRSMGKSKGEASSSIEKESSISETENTPRKKSKVNSEKDLEFKEKKTNFLGKLTSLWKLAHKIMEVGLTSSNSNLERLSKPQEWSSMDEFKKEHEELRSYLKVLSSALNKVADSFESIKEDFTFDTTKDETESFRNHEIELKRYAEKYQKESNDEKTSVDSEGDSRRRREMSPTSGERKSNDKEKEGEGMREEEEEEEEEEGKESDSVKPLLKVKSFARMLDANIYDKSKGEKKDNSVVIDLYTIDTDESENEASKKGVNKEKKESHREGSEIRENGLDEKVEKSKKSEGEDGETRSDGEKDKRNERRSQRGKKPASYAESGNDSSDDEGRNSRKRKTRRRTKQKDGEKSEEEEEESAKEQTEKKEDNKSKEKEQILVESSDKNESSEDEKPKESDDSVVKKQDDENDGEDGKEKEEETENQTQSCEEEKNSDEETRKKESESDSDKEEENIRQRRRQKKEVKASFEKFKRKRQRFLNSKENSQQEPEQKKKEEKTKATKALESSESENDKEETKQKVSKKKKRILASSDEEGEKQPVEDSDTSEEPEKENQNEREKSDSEAKKPTSEDSSSEEEVEKKKRKRIRRRKKDSSDSSEEEGRRKRKKTEGSSSDSSGEEGKKDKKKKGRRNIKKILKKDSLQVETKEALKNEEERKKRLKERQKVFEELFPEKEGKGKQMILDFNPETKEPLVTVHKKLAKKLKPHQVKGVRFMWDSCFESVQKLEEESGSGCILAHCMGLGKTLQVITLVHTVMTHDLGVNTVLIVCPLSTVSNWIREFEMWLENIHTEPITLYDLVRYKKREDRLYHLQDWHENGGVLVLSYDLFRNLTKGVGKKEKKRKPKCQQVFEKALLDPGPDLVICDEGHLLKNEDTALSKCMSKVKTSRRIVLTGTPLQNNLVEYHCMVQFVKPNILGTRKEFCNRFVNPINNGQFEDSTELDVKIMKRRSHVLHSMLDGCIQRFDYSVLTPFLPEKHEYVLTISLTETQAKAYLHFINSLSAKSSGSSRAASLFNDYHSLQRIWTHPRTMLMQSEKESQKDLLDRDSEGSLKDFVVSTDEESSQSGSDSSDGSPQEVAPRRRILRSNANDPEVKKAIEEEEKQQSKHWWDEFYDEKSYDDLRESNKLMVLFSLLKYCSEKKDKVLVFSQSLYSLDLIEYFLARIDENEKKNDETLCGHRDTWILGSDYFRLDGSTSSENRAIWCKYFNKESNTRARLFLISTRAGGLGINLYGANRVVIFDASWNPSHDLQSIFRVYRFGQKKTCYIYRFLAEATMEEKIYERQVTKLSLAHRVVDEHQIERHYTMGNLQELYTFQPTPKEERKVPKLPKDSVLADLLAQHKDVVVGYHEHDSLLENKQEEELSEEERKAAWKEYEEEKAQKSFGFNPMLIQQGMFPQGGPIYVNQGNAGQSFINPMYIQSNFPVDALQRGIRVGVTPLPKESLESYFTRVFNRESWLRMAKEQGQGQPQFGGTIED